MKRWSLVAGLVLGGCCAAGNTPQVQYGLYSIEGQSTDGTRYSGIASIAPYDRYEHLVSWCREDVTHQAPGYIMGHQFVITWESPAPNPIYYAILPGRLDGLWEGGKGRETLTLIRADENADCTKEDHV